MMNTNEKKVEETSTQAQENTQVAETQQPQVPAQPEEKKGFFTKLKETGSKVAHSKVTKTIVAVGLAAGGFALGYSAADNKNKNSESTQTVAEPVAEVQATEVPTEE